MFTPPSGFPDNTGLSRRSCCKRRPAAKPCIEHLEERRLLSVSIGLDAGTDTLNILSDAEGDSIRLSLLAGDSNSLVVEVNGVAQTPVARDQFSKIVIQGNGGDDTLAIDQTNGFFAGQEAISVDGGDGTDRLVALYEKIINDDPDKETRADATLSLAMLHQRESEGSEDDEHPRPPNKARSTMAMKLLNRLEEEYPDTPAAARARDCLYEIQSLQPGMKAPEIVGRDAEGKEIRLSQFAGQVVVLDFWGSWSRDCRGMMEQKRELAAKFRQRPFVLLGVNSDESRATMARAIKRERMNWPNIHDGPPGKGAIVRKWNIQTWPTIYVIDQNGVIRHRNIRGKRLEQAVSDLIGVPKPPRRSSEH